MKDKGTPELQAKHTQLRAAGLDPDVFQVERFKADGILSAEQADAGITLYIWHMLATNTGAKAVDCARVCSDRFTETVGLDRMTASCRYFKAMSYVRSEEKRCGKPYGQILRAACVDELSLNSLAKHIKRRKDTAKALLVESFEVLLLAMSQVRDHEKRVADGSIQPPAVSTKKLIEEFSHL